MPRLDYATPEPPPRPNAFAFWLMYAAGGLPSAYATDVLLHVGRRPSDGGCFAIGLYALVVLAVVVAPVRRALARRGRVGSWTGAPFGVLVPPLGLGLLIAAGII